MRAILLALVFFCGVGLSIGTAPDDNAERIRRDGAHNPATPYTARERIVSNGIASIGYSKQRRILETEFGSGAIYRYLEVVPSVYRELMAAASKAGYYDANFKASIHRRACARA